MIQLETARNFNDVTWQTCKCKQIFLNNQLFPPRVNWRVTTHVLIFCLWHKGESLIKWEMLTRFLWSFFSVIKLWINLESIPDTFYLTLSFIFFVSFWLSNVLLYRDRQLIINFSDAKLRESRMKTKVWHEYKEGKG